MNVTPESIKKNIELYNSNIKKKKEERASAMAKVQELRRRKRTLTDKIAIAKLEFEEAELIQQITEATNGIKGYQLTLDEIRLQQDALEGKIDAITYSNGIKSNIEAKNNLSRKEEVDYCIDEIAKCEKAISLYTLIGDTENIKKWQEALEIAKRDLEYAEQEEEKARNRAGKVQTEQPVQTKPQGPEQSQQQDTEDSTIPGYSFVQEGGKFIERFNQVYLDASGKVIGSRKVTDTLLLNDGEREQVIIGTLENDGAKYSIKEVAEWHSLRKELTIKDKKTGANDQISYQKDENGRETYYKISNGQLVQRIRKNSRGITIENYDRGQLIEVFEYDQEGKAIDGMPGVDELGEEYIEQYFDSQLPYHEIENRALPSQEPEKTTLDSAVEATEGTTRTGQINTAAQKINAAAQETTKGKVGEQQTGRNA